MVENWKCWEKKNIVPYTQRNQSADIRKKKEKTSEKILRYMPLNLTDEIKYTNI